MSENKSVKLLFYCTKGNPELFNTDKGFVLSDFGVGSYYNNVVKLNGKIVAEADCDLVEKMGLDSNDGLVFDGLFNKESQLTLQEIIDYVGNNYYYYAIHLKNLHIFDKPRKLYDCLIHPKIEKNYYGCEHLRKAPQNMMRVEFDDLPYILISIRPEWLCKILNGEKTIEVRKSILNSLKELIR